MIESEPDPFYIFLLCWSTNWRKNTILHTKRKSQATHHLSHMGNSNLRTRGVGHFTGVRWVNSSSWEIAACLPFAPTFWRTGRVLEVMIMLLAVPTVGSYLLLRVLWRWGRRGRWWRRGRRRRRSWCRLRGRWGPRWLRWGKVVGGRWARGLGLKRVRMRTRRRPAPLVGQCSRGRRRFPSAGGRWRTTLRRPLRGESGVGGHGRVKLGRGWRERQGRGRLTSARLGGGQSLQSLRAPQALIHLVKVDVIQISGGQVEAAGETPNLGLRGRRAWRGELKFTTKWKMFQLMLIII